MNWAAGGWRLVDGGVSHLAGHLRQYSQLATPAADCRGGVGVTSGGDVSEPSEPWPLGPALSTLQGRAITAIRVQAFAFRRPDAVSVLPGVIRVGPGRRDVASGARRCASGVGACNICSSCCLDELANMMSMTRPASATSAMKLRAQAYRVYATRCSVPELRRGPLSARR